MVFGVAEQTDGHQMVFADEHQMVFAITEQTDSPQMVFGVAE